MQATIHFNRFQENLQFIELLTTEGAKLAEEKAIECAKAIEVDVVVEQPRWWQFWKKQVTKKSNLYHELINNPKPLSHDYRGEIDDVNRDFDFYLKTFWDYEHVADFSTDLKVAIRYYRKTKELKRKLTRQLKAATMLKAGSVTIEDEDLNWLAIFEGDLELTEQFDIDSAND